MLKNSLAEVTLHSTISDSTISDYVQFEKILVEIPLRWLLREVCHASIAESHKGTSV